MFRIPWWTIKCLSLRLSFQFIHSSSGGKKKKKTNRFNSPFGNHFSKSRVSRETGETFTSTKFCRCGLQDVKALRTGCSICCNYIIARWEATFLRRAHCRRSGVTLGARAVKASAHTKLRVSHRCCQAIKPATPLSCLCFQEFEKEPLKPTQPAEWLILRLHIS